MYLTEKLKFEPASPALATAKPQNHGLKDHNLT